MEQVRERTLSGSSRPAWLIGVFAAIAVLLAAIGLYGVLSHAVTQRRREIGIRMALGARSGDVVSQVLRNALGMVRLGLVLGMLGIGRADQSDEESAVRGVPARSVSRSPSPASR